jgi:hypothetical protein
MDGRDRRWMVRSAAAIYAGAALLTVLAAALPGGQGGMALEPGAVAVVASLVLLAVGTRLPTWAVFLFGPLGVALIGVAVATSDSYGDGAVLYVWPAVWTAYFFRTRGAILIVAWIGIVHAVALMTCRRDRRASSAGWTCWSRSPSSPRSCARWRSARRGSSTASPRRPGSIRSPDCSTAAASTSGSGSSWRAPPATTPG